MHRRLDSLSLKKRRLKIPFAVKGRAVVHVDQVVAGAACGCVCISCTSTLIAKKGKSRVHHFSHVVDAVCSDETVLHKLAKEILKSRIEQNLQNGLPLLLEWKCEECQETHRVDMLKKAKTVVMEHSLGTFKPDLALFNRQARPYIGVELIVTHKPEKSAIDGYAREKMTRVEFIVNDTDALIRLASGAHLFASHVDYCPAPKCDCGGIFHERHVYIHDAPCWKCGKKMKAAYMYYSFGPEGPDKFKPDEISNARRRGVILERRYSKTVGRAYLANVCPHCDHMWGRNFSFEVARGFLPGTAEAVMQQCFRCHKVVALR